MSYQTLARRAAQLRTEKTNNLQRLRTIDFELSELQESHSELIALRPQLEIAVKTGECDAFELATLESRDAELSNSINALSSAREELHKQNNLVSAALTQLQKNAKQNFRRELWKHYEDEFPELLRKFEHLVGRLLIAQLGRSGVEGDLIGVIRWLVQRGDSR